MIARAAMAAAVLACVAAPAGAAGGGAPASKPAAALPDIEAPGGASAMVKWVALVTVLSLAPAILMLVTCFTRIVVVLGLLRQALTTQQVPPNQVLFGLAVLMTLVVMAPVYRDVHRDAVRPYLSGSADQTAAPQAAERHVRGFMIRQIRRAGNVEDVYLFVNGEGEITWADVPTVSLIPAFVVSELKVAFLMGFRIFLPFLVVDLLVASVLTSMGMLMLPPVLVSLPFKLLLFVLADGWHLVVGTLMGSFA